MTRPFQVLILGIETPLGQSVLKRLREQLPILKIAVPADRYSPNLSIPPYALVFGSDRRTAFQEVHTVVCCSPTYLSDREVAKSVDCKFIEICCPYDEVVLQSCTHRLGFEPWGAIDRYQRAASIRFWVFWWLAHELKNGPEKKNDKWGISVSRGHTVEFESVVWAYAFWILAVIVRFVLRGREAGVTVQGKSDWRFVGNVIIDKGNYEFVAKFRSVDAERLRPDLAVCLVVKALGANIEEIDGSDLFESLEMRLEVRRKAPKNKH
jgi:hypothetical protein